MMFCFLILWAKPSFFPLVFGSPKILLFLASSSLINARILSFSF